MASHCPETLQWVLQHTYYKRWMQLEDADNSQLLWISGNPGCGKTVLSKFLLDHIEAFVRDRRASQRQRILYFFFDDKEEKQNSTLSFPRTLLYQMISLIPEAIDHITSAKVVDL